jgi:uncharacterized protein (TIGR03437 family)
LIGDGGLATNAPLLDAEGVCLDGAGNIYIADAGDDRVRMIAPTGIISTVAGTGVAGPLTNPYGVAADSSGNLYVADLGNNRIQKIAPNGTVTTVLAQLASPRNVLVDKAGNIYFSEFAGHRVRKIGPDGTVTLVAGTGTAGSNGDGAAANLAQLNYPAGLALDTAGNLYIADSGNNRIRKISGGTISTLLGTGSPSGASTGSLSTPTSVAIDAAGNLYVADSGNQRIRKLTPSGTISTIPVAARDLALDASGNLLVASQTRVYRLLVSGAVTTIAGNGAYFFAGDGGPATQARLNAPSGVALDAAGNLWIADTGNARIRLVSSGQINTVAGGSGQLGSPVQIGFDRSAVLFIADAAGFRIRELFTPQFALFNVAGTGAPGDGGDGVSALSSAINGPSGVAPGPGGVTYFSDTANNRVRQAAGGGVSTVAGNGYPGFNGDGSGPAVQLNAPTGLFLDQAGNLYIADTGNNRIRELSPAGIVTTIAGPAQLNAPRGVAVDGAGNVWIADTGNHRVLAMSPGGSLTVVANQLQAPVGLAIDNSSGAVYVADAGSNLVVVLTPAPTTLTELPTPITVVNAASLAAGPVAPGSLISIFGVGLTGALVLFDGAAVPPLLASDTQINVQVPLTASGAFEVESGTAALDNKPLTIVPCAPGVFTGPGGTGPVVASNQDGSVNSPSNPAPQGTVVTFYATGVGQGPVTVSVGGSSAPVLFAGNAPGFVGITQINAQLPTGIATGTVPLAIQAGGVSSQSGVTIAVQ